MLVKKNAHRYPRNWEESWNVLAKIRSHNIEITIQPRHRVTYSQPHSIYRNELTLDVVLATGPGKRQAVQVRIPKMVWFGTNPIQNLNPLHLGGPNPDPYPSTCGFCFVWLDGSGPISGSGIRVFQFMVALRYTIADRKILKLGYRCPFLKNWAPLWSKTNENRTLPHPENDSQRRVDDF